jgi:hypothetical protein
MEEIKLGKKHMGKNKVKRKIEQIDSIQRRYTMAEEKRHKEQKSAICTENYNALRNKGQRT